MQPLFTDPLWWHWVVFGLILIAAEIVVPSFVVIWFGLAALVVGAVEWLFNPSFTAELFWWIVLSILFLLLWFKVFRPADLTKRGQADDDMGTPGVVTKTVTPFAKGRAKFEVPVLGSSEWVVTANEKIEAGEPVVAVRAVGNMLKVRKAI